MMVREGALWQVGDYVYSTDLHQLCRVIETQTLWGETLYRVWLPHQDTVVRVRADRLKPLHEAGTSSCDGITYIAAAARVADALTHDVLLAPIESAVIPLPHQLQALARALANDRVRYLLADEVGLGKTIEAGLIMRELKLRGLVQRTLVVAPRGLVTQWVAEMHTYFGETFQLLASSDFAMYRRMAPEKNVWRAFPQVICTLDSVKPLDSRRGWSRAQVAEYNRERFEDLIAAGWDLVIVDEAHRLGGSTDQVARYRLGQGLKAEALLDWIYRLQQEEGDPDLKVLVFTEFVPTQEMLDKFLGDRGFSVVCLNGSMTMYERQRVQRAFAQEARMLISTDAGGEGLNLQFCHVVINYDIPWNPMRLEQRIGRVDRIGQAHVVRAANFMCEDSVEYRVREVLEEKLAIILDKFGIDKTGDVLDSAQEGQMFDDLYVEAILHPDAIASSVENVVSRMQTQAQEVRASASVLGVAPTLDPAEVQRLLTHPLPYWIETMTTAYLRHARDEGRGATVVRHAGSPVVWQLQWPDGTVQEGSFMHPGAGISHLGLEEPRIRGLVMRLPRFVQGQPLPVLALPGLPPDVHGVWSLWRIAVHTDDWHQRRIMPLFLHDDGRLLLPTARRIWDELLSAAVVIRGYLEGDEARGLFDRLMEAAEAHGKPLYTELLALHQERLTRKRDKGEYAFAARRRTVERIGLPAVRAHRLAQLEREEQAWREQINRQAQVSPDLAPLLLLRLEGGPSGG